MRTFNGKSCIIHYDSDFHGDAIICVGDLPEIRIDVEDLLSFAAEYIRGKKISAIENATVEELLSGKRE